MHISSVEFSGPKKEEEMFIQSLHLDSGLDLCFHVNTIKGKMNLHQSGGTTRALYIFYVHSHCNVMHFET